MGISEIEQEIRFIHKIMESSSRYTNIPASGYLVTGLLGLLGAWRTAAFIHAKQVTDVAVIQLWELRGLAFTWFFVFVTAILVVFALSWRKACVHHTSAWNSLSSRMVLSQIPLVIVSGILTFTLGFHGYYDMIPSMWLGIYGAILYSFSYFTGVEHKVEGGVFIALGALAAFAPVHTFPLLLGLGFGGVHLMAGIGRILIKKKGLHVSGSVE